MIEHKNDPFLPLLILWTPLVSPVRYVIKADTRYVSNETSVISPFRSISSLRGVCWLSLWESLCILTQQTAVGQGLLTHEVSRPHTTTHHSR